MGLLLGGVFVTALAFAFGAQSLLSTKRQTRIIFAAAGTPAVVLLAIFTFGTLRAEESPYWFHMLVTIALFLGAFLIVGLFGAIIGSELARLIKWLLRRHADRR